MGSQPCIYRSSLQGSSAAGLIEAISALKISTEAYDVDLAASDLSTMNLDDSFFRLEGIYAAMILALAGEQSAASNISTPSDSLTWTLDLVGHKYAGMNILQIVNSEADLVRKLPAVSERDSSLKRYRKFTYLAASDALVEASVEAYPDGRDVLAEKVTLLESTAH